MSATRAVHVAGTWMGLGLLALTALRGPWWLALAATVAGYGCDWLLDAFVGHNCPTTFSHPAASLRRALRIA